ncbi:hypothetical protein QTG54_016659 [Skeletonema marinoi]|uniref:Plastid lipid-associated protein/fibrillin conserved domain-containing protein n=1 Tax=Skeletonema marinoi TaxID=267567 RepID=A0AAD8XSF6_9STRA|nr:hypothetical protein QTG54_016659 [Skeletonema marinoi]
MIAALFLFSSLHCGSVSAFSSSSDAPLSPTSLKFARVERNAEARRSSLQPLKSSSLINSALFSTSNDDSSTTSEAERLRQKALQLRAEADAAEKQLSPTRSSRQAAAAMDTTEAAVEYFDLKDSCWELSYRFANEPENKDDDNDDNSKNKVLRKFYSGKVQLQFLSDGYTTNLSTKSNEGVSEQQAIINKVWGWDLEVSDQDSLSYILFSADITLPPPIGTSERFYFQARVDGDASEGEALSLVDGSVTVKRDISAPGSGWWGIFKGADGILAQFRQLGEFKCRPIAKP